MFGKGNVNGLSAVFAAGTFMILFCFLIFGFMLLCQWKIYKRAGKKGWEALIPIYNYIVLLEIVNLSIWYIALSVIPFVNIYAMFKVNIALAKRFGKSTGFGIGLTLLGIVFYPLLAFDDDPVENPNPSTPVEQFGPIPNNPGFQPLSSFQSYEQSIQNSSIQNMPESPQPATPSVQNSLDEVEEIIDMSTEPVETIIQQENGQMLKFCPKCGIKLEGSSNMCFMCGYKF